MLINVKLPTIVGILIFMSRIDFVLSGVEYEKSFITSGPDKKISINCDHFLIYHLNNVLGTQKKYLIEAVLLST